MMKTVAAVLEELGQPLVVKTIKLPEIVYGQVLVKILFSGVCRSQIMEVRGKRGEDTWLPHLLGHEGSGVVVAIGDGVTKVNPGDEVILGWMKGEGINAPGAKYSCGNKFINSGGVTTFSQYSIVSENRIVKKPAGLALDTAALFGCALLTGAGMVLNELQPTIDNTVVVVGLGGIGLSALIALNALDVENLIAVDISDQKLQMAKRIGANHFFNSLNNDVVKSIIDLTDGGADACIESGGKAKTIELGFSLIRKNGGRLLFASHPPDDEMICLRPHDLISGKQISGSWGGASRPDQDIPKLFELFANADSILRLLITQRYSLQQVNEAIDDLESGKVLRPLIVMEH